MANNETKNPLPNMRIRSDHEIDKTSNRHIPNDNQHAINKRQQNFLDARMNQALRQIKNIIIYLKDNRLFLFL